MRTNQVHSVLAVSLGRPSELLAGCPDYHLRCYDTGRCCVDGVCRVLYVCVEVLRCHHHNNTFGTIDGQVVQLSTVSVTHSRLTSSRSPHPKP